MIEYRIDNFEFLSLTRNFEHQRERRNNQEILE